MKTRARKHFSRMILAAALCLAVAVPAVAQSLDEDLAGPPDDGAFGGPEHGDGRHGHHGHGRREVPEPVRLHLELGRYYLLDGQYEAARDHFLAVAQMEPPAGAPAAASEDDGDGRPARGERAALRGRMHAYLMAAVSSVLMGDRDGGIALAEEGQALRPERPEGADGARHEGHGDRVDPLATFLEDPDTFSANFAGGADALEQRLLEIDGAVDENEAQ